MIIFDWQLAFENRITCGMVEKLRKWSQPSKMGHWGWPLGMTFTCQAVSSFDCMGSYMEAFLGLIFIFGPLPSISGPTPGLYSFE